MDSRLGKAKQDGRTDRTSQLESGGVDVQMQKRRGCSGLDGERRNRYEGLLL